MCRNSRSSKSSPLLEKSVPIGRHPGAAGETLTRRGGVARYVENWAELHNRHRGQDARAPWFFEQRPMHPFASFEASSDGTERVEVAVICPRARSIEWVH